uniref:Uncharacterized protein n=1 Tax=Oryza punctata TaxID=4537 RepID=A0A0E0LXK2_ORYPU
MDELVSSPPSFSLSSGTACFPVLEFEVCEVPEQLLLMGDEDATAWPDMSPAAVRAERTAAKWRGRKPGPRSGGAPPIGHVEA